MAAWQRIRCPLKLSRTAFQYRCMQDNCKSGTELLKKDVKLWNWNSVTGFPVLKNGQVIRKLWSLHEKSVLNKETEGVSERTTPKRLDEIDLTSPDLINTFWELLQSVTRLKKLTRAGEFHKELHSFVKSQEFIDYCNAVEQKLPLLSPDDLKLLINFNLFRILPSSALMQKIYTLILENINHYTLTDALSIFVSVNNQLASENSKARLLQAISKEYIALKLRTLNNSEIDFRSLAYFCSAQELHFQIKRKLLRKISRNFNEIRNKLDIHALCRIISAFNNNLFFMEFRPEMIQALNEKLCEGLNPFLVAMCLAGYQNLVLNDYTYSPEVLDNIIEAFMREKIKFLSFLTICSRFNLLEYQSSLLVEKFEKLLSDPEFQLTSAQVVNSSLRFLSAHYFHPFGYTGDNAAHKECLAKLDEFDCETVRPHLLEKWCLPTLVLGLQRKFKLINQLFEHYLNNYESKEFVMLPEVCGYILTLNAFARLHCPTEVMELPEKFLRQCFVKMKSKEVGKLNNYLRDLYSEKGQIFEFCTTSLHQFINFAVLVDEDPNADNSQCLSSNEIFNIENIKRSSSSKLKLFLIHSGEFPCSFRNSSDLPGQIQLQKMTLEPLNCKVVFFSGKAIAKMNDLTFSTYVRNTCKIMDSV